MTTIMPPQKNILYRLSPLFLLIFLDSFGYFVVMPVLLQLFYHPGLLPAATSIATRNTLTGVVMSLALLSAVLVAPFMGSASDRYGRKKTLLFCVGCVCLGFLLPIVGIMQKNIVLIIIGRMIAGIGSASQPVAQAAVADVCKREDKAIFLGWIALMMTLALVLAPLAGGFLISPRIVPWFNSKTPFELALALGIINFLLILFFFAETKPLDKKAVSYAVRDVITGFPRVIKQYQLGGWVILFLCLELGWSQYYQAIPLFLQGQLHFSVQNISLLSASMGVTMLIGLLAVYPLLLRYFSVKYIMRYSVWLVLIGLFVCALWPMATIVWIFSALIALCTGMAYVSLVTLMSNRVAKAMQGMLMGCLSAILYGAWMATGFFSGVLVSWYALLPLYLAPLFLGVAFSAAYKSM